MSELDGASVGLVLLAAGGSARLGQPKQLVSVGGKTLLRRAAQAAEASACRPLVAVLGGTDTARLRDELAGLEFAVVENTDWARGMGSSVRCGLQALLAMAPNKEMLGAVVFAVCDQPFLSAGVLDDLARAHTLHGADIAACAYGGTAGVPALFGRAFFAELLVLPDRVGAKQLLVRHASAAVLVPFPEGALDIDTPDDYARLRQSTADTLPLA